MHRKSGTAPTPHFRANKQSGAPTRHSAQKPHTPAPHLARYTGLKGADAKQWKQGPEHYITELLRTTLQDVNRIQAAPCPVPVTTGDKFKTAMKGGTIGFSVSFMMAKAWTSLWGWLAVLAKDDPRLFFLIGAGGYVAIASFAHATLAKVAGFAPGGNYGGPAPLDKIAFDNYVTLLGMWYVATADGETEQADRIAKALQEVIDSVIERAKQHEDGGHPLRFDFRQHPILGAWLRNGHFHLFFFAYSFLYLGSGGLAPLLREACMKLPGSVLERAGLYALFDFLVSAACGQIAGVLTLAGHMFGNKHIQRGPDKPGLHQRWPQELEAAGARLARLNIGWSKLYGIRQNLIGKLAQAQMNDDERAQCQQVLDERLLPAIDAALQRLQKKQGKWIDRSDKLQTAPGRDAIARDQAAVMAFQGVGKTTSKLINESPHAQGLRSAGEVLGNIPSLIPMAYALVTMYTLFATFMPFAEHAPGPMASNGTAPWPEGMPSAANHTLASEGISEEVQRWSLALGWILIAGFSGLRPFSIPGAELLLNLILAAMLKLGHWTGLRQRASPAAPGIEQLPPPPPRKKRQKRRGAEFMPDESSPAENASPSPHERPDVVMNLKFSEPEELKVVGRSYSVPDIQQIDESEKSDSDAHSDGVVDSDPGRDGSGQDQVTVNLQSLFHPIETPET